MRRWSLFWLAWALPAALCAAQFRAPEAQLPVQLSLPLEAPAAAVLPSAPALTAAVSLPSLGATPQQAPEHVDHPAAPVPLAAAAAAAIPGSVARALKAGGAHAFYKAVAATGYSLPRGDDHQERLLREGADRAAADRAFFDGQRAATAGVAVPQPPAAPAPKAAQPAAKKRATKIDYDTFGRLLSLTPRLSESPFRDTEAKRRILLASGYTHLIGPGGKRIPLSIADEARVGRAFQHTLQTYRRRKT